MSVVGADLEKLRGALFLAGLNEGEFKRFARETAILSVRPGDVLFREGDAAHAFYFVLDGWAALFREHENGERTAVHLVGPLESFAEAVIARGARYPVSAEAATDLRVARIETERFRDLMTRSPDLALSIVAAIYGKLRRLVERIEQDRGWSPQRRVAAFLYMFSGAESGSCHFELPVEQRYVAARLSMTPTTFSRALSGLASIGIHARRRKIVVSDVGRLRRFAQDGERP